MWSFSQSIAKITSWRQHPGNFAEVEIIIRPNIDFNMMKLVSMQITEVNGKSNRFNFISLLRAHCKKNNVALSDAMLKSKKELKVVLLFPEKVALTSIRFFNSQKATQSRTISV